MRVRWMGVVVVASGVMALPAALHAEDAAEPPCNALCRRWMSAGSPQPQAEVTGSIPPPAIGSPLEIAPIPSATEEAPKRRRRPRVPASSIRADALRPNPLTANIVSGPGGVPIAKLGWSSPARSGPARFFLEVRALVGSQSRELLTGFYPGQSASIEVPDNARKLFWRVSGVYPRLQRYAAADWQSVVVPPGK